MALGLILHVRSEKDEQSNNSQPCMTSVSSGLRIAKTQQSIVRYKFVAGIFLICLTFVVFFSESVSLWYSVDGRSPWHHFLVSSSLGLIGYFVYHSVQGDRGLLSYMRMATEVSRSEAQLDGIVTTRKALSHRVALLHPKSLDPDMLEEQARYTLNYANPNDVIIMTPTE